jgi:hypothetical protein
MPEHENSRDHADHQKENGRVSLFETGENGGYDLPQDEAASVPASSNVVELFGQFLFLVQELPEKVELLSAGRTLGEVINDGVLFISR